MKGTFYQKGDIIFRHRDVSNNFYIVLKGRVGVLIQKTKEEINLEREKIWELRKQTDKFSISSKELNLHFGRVALSSTESYAREEQGTTQRSKSKGKAFQIEPAMVKIDLTRDIKIENGSDKSQHSLEFDQNSSELVEEWKSIDKKGKGERNQNKSSQNLNTLDKAKASKDLIDSKASKIGFLEGLEEILDTTVVYRDAFIK